MSLESFSMDGLTGTFKVQRPTNKREQGAVDSAKFGGPS
jgi:hypothetical protein